ncbi:MAG: hypothetical protein JWP94_3122 [Mucilaginibacter sp.]|jgi:hypothetical protein|nr:hypothetical protein [Mucilaginibacter sp.]
MAGLTLGIKSLTMKKKVIITSLLLSCFLISFGTITNLNGKWAGLLKTEQGNEFPLLYNFKINGDQLTGTAKTPEGDMPINDGKITNGTFTFNVIVKGLEIDHTGKFYGDSVGVDISLDDIKSHATLKRVP